MLGIKLGQMIPTKTTETSSRISTYSIERIWTAIIVEYLQVAKYMVQKYDFLQDHDLPLI